MGDALELAGQAANELALFAAVGFLLCGLDDLLVDAIWIGRTLRRRLTVYRRHPRAHAAGLVGAAEGGLAVLVPAWDEARVIGPMLQHALRAWGDAEVAILVGCYPNDPATYRIASATGDARVVAVMTSTPGPTTKADCLNALYRALRDLERERGRPFAAAVLHDAEDVVHAAEPAVFGALLPRAGMIQLPVLPLIDGRSRWVSGHYCDEFAESHGKELVVREAVGAAVPSAGVACAIRRDALDALATAGGGEPFNPRSLTEDYEMGLRLHALGFRGVFVRLPASAGRKLVATREHFPATVDAAVRQKARWMAGIALAGWDRLGWRGTVAERWMRLRDRRGPLCALILFAGYVALVLWALAGAIAWLGGPAMPSPGPFLRALLLVNVGLLAWRLLVRFGFVTAAYGWREGVRSVPRVLVANVIAMAAARRALGLYLTERRTGRTRWEKTEHLFPDAVPAE